MPLSSSTVDTCLTVLKACFAWATKQKLMPSNPAEGASVTVHGRRTPAWFRTENVFWDALAHVPEELQDVLIVCAYTGLRIRELAALQWDDVQLLNHRIKIWHNFDPKGRPSTVKSEESETWMPLHPEAEAAIQRRKAADRHQAAGTRLVFLGPRGGRIGSTLLNDTLASACRTAGLPYRVTAHGLRHSLANWLKVAVVPNHDIQAVLRHTDYRTTAGYLHTDDDEKIQAINRLQGRPDSPHHQDTAAAKTGTRPPCPFSTVSSIRIHEGLEPRLDLIRSHMRPIPPRSRGRGAADELVAGC